MPKKILIIEDETTLLELMQTQLVHAGYEVRSADDGEKGVQLANSWKPDLILLDFLLPRKNGIEVIKALKDAQNAVPVLVISNSGNELEIEEMKKLGIEDYLVKANFAPAEVLARVAEILGDDTLIQEIPTPAVSAPPGTEANPESAAGNTDIVLIEDDRFLQELLRKKISFGGISIVTAYDGEEGMRLVKELKPKLILLDVILPGMDGFEFLNLIKNDAEVKDIPVIVLSNLGQREEIDRAMELGAIDFLIKANFAPDEIFKKIEAVLKKK